jgi:short-subunit dehydrogenase
MRAPRSVLITGASSGLGAALARAYAAPGVRLALTGRNAARLAAVATACRAAGSEVSESYLDVCDGNAVDSWIGRADAQAPLDLVIANAGISGGTAQGMESVSQARAIFAINLDATIGTAESAIARMRGRGHGQIALMSSLAGLRGFPGAPAYCSSKAAVRVWGEAMRPLLRTQGISLAVVCPGFVRTPMTDANRFAMPFLMDAERAARIIRRGLARDRARIAFPFPMYAAVWLLAALPPAWVDGLLHRLPKKGAG